MVLGLPPALGHGDGGDVEVAVLIALVAGIEVEDVGAQSQRRQQPGLQIVELVAARSRAGHVEAPGFQPVLLDRADDALRIGVCARDEVERLMLGRVDAHLHPASLGGGRSVAALTL